MKEKELNQLLTNYYQSQTPIYEPPPTNSAGSLALGLSLGLATSLAYIAYGLRPTDQKITAQIGTQSNSEPLILFNQVESKKWTV